MYRKNGYPADFVNDVQQWKPAQCIGRMYEEGFNPP